MKILMYSAETPDVKAALISVAITFFAFGIIFGYPKIKKFIKGSLQTK